MKHSPNPPPLAPHDARAALFTQARMMTLFGRKPKPVRDRVPVVAMLYDVVRTSIWGVVPANHVTLLASVNPAELPGKAVMDPPSGPAHCCLLYTSDAADE